MPSEATAEAGRSVCLSVPLRQHEAHTFVLINKQLTVPLDTAPLPRISSIDAGESGFSTLSPRLQKTD